MLWAEQCRSGLDSNGVIGQALDEGAAKGAAQDGQRLETRLELETKGDDRPVRGLPKLVYGDLVGFLKVEHLLTSLLHAWY